MGSERACAINPAQAMTKPTAAGDASSYDGVCGAARTDGTTDADTENVSTTNLTVADKWGNVVEYTLTIEQTGGSGQVVPRHGFILNNELTDFSTVYDAADPNRIEGGKLTTLYKNPNYTGITPEFWGSCDAVGGAEDWVVWGTPNCGKGQPGQVGRVGHGASPARFPAGQ